MRNGYYEPPFKMKDYIKFLEWQERREELLAEKKEKKSKADKDKKPQVHTFTFAEGMILAYMAQFIVGPLYKVALVHLGVQ